MQSPSEHDQFAPPRRPRRLRTWLLAIGVHAVLVAALMWSVRPPKQAQEAMVEAEFWANSGPAALLQTPPPAPEPRPQPEPDEGGCPEI